MLSEDGAGDFCNFTFEMRAEYMNAVARDYRKAVKKYLVCPADYRAKYLEFAAKDAETCLQDNPDASLEDLKLLIGPPKAAAESYLEGIPPEIMQEYLRKHGRNRRFSAVFGVVLAAALILLITYMSYMHSNFTEIVYLPSEASAFGVLLGTVS